MTVGFQLVAQLAEFVNYSVEDDGGRAGFVPDGLRAAGKLDGAATSRTGDDGRCGEKTFFIRDAMNDCVEHAADGGLDVYFRT